MLRDRAPILTPNGALMKRVAQGQSKEEEQAPAGAAEWVSLSDQIVHASTVLRWHQLEDVCRLSHELCAKHLEKRRAFAALMRFAEIAPLASKRSRAASKTGVRGKLKRELTTLISRHSAGPAGGDATANPLAAGTAAAGDAAGGADGAVGIEIVEDTVAPNKSLYSRQLVKIKALIIGSSDKEVDDNPVQRACNRVLCRPHIPAEDHMGLS